MTAGRRGGGRWTWIVVRYAPFWFAALMFIAGIIGLIRNDVVLQVCGFASCACYLINGLTERW